MTGKWTARCRRHDVGCTWTITAFTEEAAREAGRQHFREAHGRWQATCRRDKCGWSEIADSEESAQAAYEHHRAEAHPPKPERTYSYRGKPNKTQLRLLCMATRGELLAYEQHVYHAKADSEISLEDPSSTLGAPTMWWCPRSLPRGIHVWVHGLREAGLLRDPKQPFAGVRHRRLDYQPFRVTPEGHRVLARFGWSE